MPLPNEIQTGRLNAILHKLLGITEGAPAPSLAPDVFSMLALEVDRPEWKFLAGERLCCASKYLAAGGAGQYTSFILWNPAGSGILAVVTRIFNHLGAAATYVVRANATEPSGAGYASAASYRGLRDFRYAPSPTAKPTCLLYYQTTASPAGINVLGQWRIGAGGEIRDIDVVLPPGTGLSCENSTVNTEASVGFFWRERALEPSETR